MALPGNSDSAMGPTALPRAGALVNGVNAPESLNHFSTSSGRLEISEEWHAEGKAALKATLTVETVIASFLADNDAEEGALPGRPNSPMDWHGYSDLSFDVYNANDVSVDVGLQLRSSKRFQKSFSTLKPKARTQVHVNLTRVAEEGIALNAIYRIEFQIKTEPGTYILFYDNFRLIK